MRLGVLQWQISSLLDKYWDYENHDWPKLSAENFQVMETRFVNIMVILYETGYIEGIAMITQ